MIEEGRLRMRRPARVESLAVAEPDARRRVEPHPEHPDRDRDEHVERGQAPLGLHGRRGGDRRRLGFGFGLGA